MGGTVEATSSLLLKPTIDDLDVRAEDSELPMVVLCEWMNERDVEISPEESDAVCFFKKHNYKVDVTVGRGS